MTKKTKKCLHKVGIIILFTFSIFGMVKFYSIYKDDFVDTVKETRQGVEKSINNLKKFPNNP